MGFGIARTRAFVVGFSLKVFEGVRRFSRVFGGLRGPLGVPGGPRRLPRGSQKSPEIFDFLSIFRRRRRRGVKKNADEKEKCAGNGRPSDGEGM